MLNPKVSHEMDPLKSFPALPSGHSLGHGRFGDQTGFAGHLRAIPSVSMEATNHLSGGAEYELLFQRRLEGNKFETNQNKYVYYFWFASRDSLNSSGLNYKLER